MKLKVFVWYHDYDVMTEKPFTEKVEREIDVKMPDNFSSDFMNCVIRGGDIEKECADKLSYSVFEQAIKDLKLKPSYVRLLIEISPGIFWNFSDQFKYDDRKFTELSNTAEL